MNQVHPRYHHTPEDLFLTAFVYIDDWLKPYHDILPKQPAQKASYSEIITIAIVGESSLSRSRASGTGS